MQPQFTLSKTISGGLPRQYFLRGKDFKAGVALNGAQDSSIPSDGSVRIVFAPEGRGTEPLTDSDKSSIVWVIENEASISKALILSLLEEYPSLQAQYGYSSEEQAELMPDIKSTEDLRALIGLHTVYVHPCRRMGFLT